uniref:Uncharacterized protein n=1 Tax=Aegilops tauschii subsp. strangulata TaxID=200361 RepID=A0A453FVY2_AEGTS
MCCMQVQHLIEKCICYDMNKEECVQALEKHANILPAVTSTGNSSVHSHIALIGSFEFVIDRSTVFLALH